MKNVKIVRVAEWDGWCGACAAERPLVLTRTGRQRLRTWLAAAADDSRPLVLTCRLCGTGVDVPLERDDPPPAELVDDLVDELLAAPADVVSAPTAAPVPVVAAAPAPPVTASDAELADGRQAVAQALGALLVQRSAAVPVAVVPAPAVPMQRTATTGGLAELHLLADGIDLLSSGGRV